jgi:diguanylate cyclase (GGDEF)-like protein
MDRLSEIIYEIARHRIAAGAASEPRSAYASCIAAGRLALTHHGPVEAVKFLAGAAQAAAAAGIDLDVRFRVTYATALLRSGDFTTAYDQVTHALSGEHDPLRRAELAHLLATIQQAADDSDQAVATVQQGLTELGVALPTNMPLLIVSTLIRFVRGLLVGASRRRFGAAAGIRRHRAQIEASLLQTGAYAAALVGDNAILVCSLLCALLPVNRLGRSALRVRVLTGLGYVAAVAGARRLSRRMCAAAERDATRIDDPGMAAVAAWTGETIDYFFDGRVSALIEVLEERGPLMDLPHYLTAVSGFTPQLISAGHTATAGLWIKRAQNRLRVSAGGQEAFLVESMAGAVEAVHGRAAAGTATLQAALDRLPHGASAYQRMYLLWARLMILTEQGEFGAEFDEVVAEIDDAQISRRHPHRPAIWYAIAYGRLAQAHAIKCRVSSEDEVQRALARANTVIKALRGARIPRLRAGHLALRAWSRHIAGRDREALRLLHRAQRAADGAGAPLLTFDIEHLHARILQAQQHLEEAEERATFALMLAIRHGWEYRARAIREEFEVRDPVDGSRRTRPSVASGVSSSGQSDARQRRRLEALQQVSATAASVLDPDELIRVALTITLRMLSAERAFLFLADQDTLRPLRGCDADGNDLRTLTNYSSTLVDRVQQTGEALVVTGSEHGAALGSQSAVLHGLRSILVAPLQLKGRLLGVVYLDSRVARGIFTADDVELLVTINQQVAASLETARAAQLDAEIQAANRQRGLAETLSMSMTDLNATLDPDEVLRRLLHTVGTTLPGDSAVLLRRDADQLVLTGHEGARAADGPPAGGAHVTGDAGSSTFALASHPTLEVLATRDTPMASNTMPLPATLSHVLGEPRSWLAVPIALRQQHTGVIVTGSSDPDSYSDVEVKIAAVLGDQGAVAYDNARLFSRVHEAATIDALTSLATRHHFWELAEQALATATRHLRPLAAIMLDIDHFKAVNDTHGHAVGDVVLREVAARVRSTLRDADIVGRYGGEEFAMLLPETADAAPLAERLRATVARTPVPIEDGEVPVTVSVGISYLEPGDDLDSLLGRADAALYQSKASGRNCVSIG